MTTADLAKALAEADFYVFPVRENKTPMTPNGLKDSSNDPEAVYETFTSNPDALVGIHCGPSGIVVLDIDVKFDDNGTVTVDGYESLDKQWLDVPETLSYTSLSGHGRHLIYRTPKDAKRLNGVGRYRKMLGVDRRAGESYIVYPLGEPINRADIVEAPEWLCDETRERDFSEFDGTLQEWYDGLQTGDPNLLVRRAMDRIQQKWESAGNDFDHAAVIEAQHNAVRLGAEGNPGIPQLIELIEDLFFSREGSHSRPESEWAEEFAEGLLSGIRKYGTAIDLVANLPEWSLDSVPADIPDHLIVGSLGTKEDFRVLLASLLKATDNDSLILSILWNAPKVKDISREWGIEFVHRRIQSARNKPEPIRENPSLPRATEPEPEENAPEVVLSRDETDGFLTAEERKIVKNTRTFIDDYYDASLTKGFARKEYEFPAAWTVLSMACGRKAFLPLAKSMGLNLWFITLGESTTGKSTADRMLSGVLDILMAGESYYNIGATSSPAGAHEALLERDGVPSIVQDDEAANFFRELRNPNGYMQGIMQLQADWYEGDVKPQNKVRLPPALRGKRATTSLNVHLWGTPDNTLDLLDASMFETGYLARYNWSWGQAPEDPDRKYRVKLTERKNEHLPEAFFPLVMDLIGLRASLGDDQFPIKGSEEVQERINKAFKDFDRFARTSPRYDRFKMAIDRMGMETLWKCSALLALSRGDDEITMPDVLVSIRYATDWLHDLVRVAESISESPYSRDLEEIEKFIAESGGKVSHEMLLHHFRGKVVKSKSELIDRVGFLLDSGRVLRENENNKIRYRINI